MYKWLVSFVLHLVKIVKQCLEVARHLQISVLNNIL